MFWSALPVFDNYTDELTIFANLLSGDTKADTILRNRYDRDTGKVSRLL